MSRTDYSKAVQQAVLKAYELVPEVGRQQYQTETIQPGQTYLNCSSRSHTELNGLDAKTMLKAMEAGMSSVIKFHGMTNPVVRLKGQ